MLHHRQKVREALLREGVLPQGQGLLRDSMLHNRQEMPQGVLQNRVLQQEKGRSLIDCAIFYIDFSLSLTTVVSIAEKTVQIVRHSKKKSQILK